MKSVNIFGDSFGASNHESSWTKLLELDYNVNNYCINGASEYRILNCVKENLPATSIVILVHTNPYRVYVDYNPLHRNGKHKNCDLVFSDIENYKNTEFGNASLNFYKHIFSEKMYNDFYKMCIQHQIKLLEHCKVIHTTHFDVDLPGICFDYQNNTNKGSINHYNEHGNYLIYRQIKQEIEKHLHDSN